jgi:pimeloyl-ACP methyl ester carboxylesterase
VVEERPRLHTQGRRRLVLLIHGYNTTESGALESYEELVASLQALGPVARPMLEHLVALLWPGDVHLGPLSFALYPTAIGPARESAERLAAFLQDLRGPEGTPVEVVLVAHSLGSRVALELLQRCARSRPSARMARSCLMGAAVPVPMLDAGGSLVDGATLSRTLVLYSPSDAVLAWAFPLGETLAREGAFPEAVGRFGRPLPLWNTHHQMFKNGLQGYGHGDYWKRRETASPLASFLGVAMPSATPVAVISGNQLPEALEVGARELRRWGLPGSRWFG